MRKERLEAIAYFSVAALGVGVLGFLFFKYVFFAVLPFLIAWAIAFSTRPLAIFLSSKTKIPTKALRVILTILLTVLVLGLIGVCVWLLALELWKLLSRLGDLNGLKAFIESMLSGGVFGELFSTFGETLSGAFYEVAVSLLSGIGGALSGFVGAVPKLLIFLLVTVISSIYFALDLDWVNNGVKGLLPPVAYKWLVSFKDGFFSVGIGYIRSYLLLMVITFSIMLVGLFLLKVPYALLLAVIIAFLDLLPVIGVGTVIIPWSVYELLMGNTTLAIGLLVLFVLNEVVRQFAEPKIIGKSLGVHPIITLALLYVGYSLFGFIGILLVPIATVLIDISVNKKNTA